MAPPVEPAAQADTFRILTVCTGNICRSPQAEQLLRARLPQALGVDPASIVVTSAGTMALDDDLMDAPAAAEAVRLGITDSADHRARRLAPALVEQAGLVIALAREHRSAAVRAVPRANARTFTLIELTRTLEAMAADDQHGVEPLGDDGAPAFLRRVVTAARTARAVLPPSATKPLDIDDPYRRSPAHYRRSADAVADHVDRLAAALAALASQ